MGKREKSSTTQGSMGNAKPEACKGAEPEACLRIFVG